MLKGLALTPPVIGRIAIGKVVEKNGKRLPEKDDEFTITSQVQSRDGWVLHPVDECLRKDSGAKLRSIPVRLLFDDPDLSLRAYYTMFDRATGRPLCVGNGESCKRATLSGMQSLVSARQTHVDRRWRPWLTIRCQWAASGAATAPQSGWPCAWEAL